MPQEETKEPTHNIDVAVTPEQDRDCKGPPGRICGGSYDEKYNLRLIRDTVEAMRRGEETNKERLDACFLLATQGMAGIGPKNELEGMIASQMVAAHCASLQSYRSAAHADTYEVKNLNLSLALKASRTFAVLNETLLKLRGKHGSQTIHVHHHNTDARTQVAADQATVNISGNGGQGAGQVVKGTQPHERKAIEHKPAETIDFSAAMRGKNQKRQTM